MMATTRVAATRSGVAGEQVRLVDGHREDGGSEQ